MNKKLQFPTSHLGAKNPFKPVLESVDLTFISKKAFSEVEF